jgi:hypothetical protein
MDARELPVANIWLVANITNVRSPCSAPKELRHTRPSWLRNRNSVAVLNRVAMASS